MIIDFNCVVLVLGIMFVIYMNIYIYFNIISLAWKLLYPIMVCGTFYFYVNYSGAVGRVFIDEHNQ